jgi:hypothetical protein
LLNGGETRRGGFTPSAFSSEVDIAATPSFQTVIGVKGLHRGQVAAIGEIGAAPPSQSRSGGLEVPKRKKVPPIAQQKRVNSRLKGFTAGYTSGTIEPRFGSVIYYNGGRLYVFK